ncbi:MAG: DUF479 domain-containing protein [Proteobacteria bacterium]|nr:DUF479 domain-containing protein [Pseudomonadota bacterium]
MNYLAHLFLSGNSAGLLVGNLLGDFVKGEIGDRYEGSIKKGLVLHRKIDSYTNSHTRPSSSRNLIGPKRRKFAGIIVDICYDHFLIKHWSDYSEVALPEFISNVHHILQNYERFFPGKLRFFLSKSLIENLLGSNRHMAGVEYTLHRISKRLKRENDLPGAIEEIELNYTALENDFLAFFPDLLDYTFDVRST